MKVAIIKVSVDIEEREGVEEREGDVGGDGRCWVEREGCGMR